MGFTPSDKAARETRPHLRQTAIRWQDRDQNIVELVAEHPATTEQLTRTFFTGPSLETARKKASRRLNRLCRKRLIDAVGMVLLRGTGRPQYVYCDWQPKASMLEHEIWITELRLFYHDCPFQRSVSVGKTIADALLEKDGTQFFVEVDTGKMDRRQMQAKWQRYPTNLKGFILVLCLSETRMQRLLRNCDLVKDVALFTTFARLKSALKEPWIDGYGNTTTI